jgi:tricorn protease-like protein
MRVCLVVMSVLVVVSGCELPDELEVGDVELEAGSVRNGKHAYATLTVLPSGTGWGVNVVNPDGSGLTRLPPGSQVTHEADPAFSPDGKKILFARTEDLASSSTEIYRMNADGACLTRLTTSPVGNYKPSWSPDGQRIAFERRCRIYTMNADGTNVDVVA